VSGNLCWHSGNRLYHYEQKW